jgi:hypothetical protein
VWPYLKQWLLWIWSQIKATSLDFSLCKLLKLLEILDAGCVFRKRRHNTEHNDTQNKGYTATLCIITLSIKAILQHSIIFILYWVSNNYCYVCLIRFNVIILRIFGEEMLSVVLAVVLPSLVMLSLVILRAIMLSVVMLSVVAPPGRAKEFELLWDCCCAEYQ